MISVQSAVGKGQILAKKALNQIRRLIFAVRMSRFVRKFSWKKAALYTVLSLLISAYCFVLGGLTVLMPPMVSIGLATLPVPILIWATPELRRVPLGLLRKLFFATVFVQMCIPIYYAVQIPGLPWLSVRRIVLLFMIILFSVSFAGSKEVRSYLYRTMSVNKYLFYCIFGYYTWCFLSIFTSANPSASMTQFVEFTLNWYLPLLACVLVIRTMDDVRRLLKAILIFAFIVTAVGVLDFIGEKNYAIYIMPKALVNALSAANPSFAMIANTNPYREGVYRSGSRFSVALSYGEFAAIVAPIGGYFLFHARTPFERWLGALTILATLVNLFVSSARGGSVAFLASMPILLALWVARVGRIDPKSMVGPLGAGLALLAITCLMGLVFTWGRLHKMVFGSGETASSDAARFDQAHLAWPHILSNPITGHGIGMAGEVIGYFTPGGQPTVDSSVLMLAVETGVPGISFFFCMLGIASWLNMRIYLRDSHPDAAVGAALACSFIAYSIYRLVLSQRENEGLLFVLVGLACVVVKLAADRMKKQSPESAKTVFSVINRPFADSTRQPAPAATTAGNTSR